jgi:zinc transport system permease protein
MLELAFMQRALVAAVTIGVVCGALGFFVVLRRMAFIGIGISHAAIGGVAIGLVLGLPPLAAAGAFSLAVALGIAGASRRARLSEDAVIGTFLSGAMALGVVLMSLRRGYQQDLFAYLFGNVLAVSFPELVAFGAAGAVILALLALTHRELLFVAFDEEAARAYGHATDALNAFLIVLVAATVVLAMRLVGALLVEALLVIPAVVASLWTARYRAQIALSALLGGACGVLGLVSAFRFDLAAGATIVLVAVALFLASLALRRAT